MWDLPAEPAQHLADYTIKQSPCLITLLTEILVCPRELFHCKRTQVQIFSLLIYKGTSNPYMLGTINIFSLIVILPRTLVIKFRSASNYKQGMFFHEV